MIKKMETLPSLPPNSNPFEHDLWNMGQRIGKEHMLMFRNHPLEDLDYLIVVNTTTGERVKLYFKEEDNDINNHPLVNEIGEQKN